MLIEYDPHPDGEPDPGEIVWAWVPYEEDATHGKDRPVLIISRDGDTLTVLPLSSKDHDFDEQSEAAAGRFWIDIGSGVWDSRQRPSEVRTNRIIRVDIEDVRRDGAVLDRPHFEAVATDVRRHLE